MPEPILLAAYEDLKHNRQAPTARKRLAVERIIRLYQRWDKTEQILKWRSLLDQQQQQSETDGSRVRYPLLEDYKSLLSEVIRGPQLGTLIFGRLETAFVEPLVEDEERPC